MNNQIVKSDVGLTTVHNLDPNGDKKPKKITFLGIVKVMTATSLLLVALAKLTIVYGGIGYCDARSGHPQGWLDKFKAQIVCHLK